MKVAAVFSVALASCSRLGAALKFRAEEDASPVEQVTQLLTELKANIESDGKAEQKSYDKYACWCEDTLAEKAEDITKAKETIEDLRKLMVKLKGETAEHTAEIKQLEKEIKANEEAQKEATQIREKDSAGYQEEKTESEQCIGALEAAIGVLGGESKKKGFLETFQQAQLLSVVAGVRAVIERPATEKSLAEKDLEAVRHFVAHPGDFVSKGTSSMSAAQVSNNPFGDYAPQSTQIGGILKGMYDTFAKDLEKANVEEAEKQKGFEELIDTKQEELKTLKETLKTQKKDLADKSKTLSDSKVEVQDTQEQLEKDEIFFAETKDSCKGRAGEWAQRSRSRSEELTGINEAVEILTSDEAKETFKNASKKFFFLQVASSGKGRSAAYAQLKHLAGQYQNLRIAQLAVRVKAGGHFDKIIATIDNMIAHCREEGQQDIEERDWCEARQNKNKNDMEDLNGDIKKAKQTVERLEDEVKGKEENIEALEKDINATETNMEELKEMRIEEQAEFAQGVKDDTNAVELLNKAIRHLSKYYSDKKEASLVQKGRVDPKPEVSWAGKNNNKREGEGRGVVAILSLIKEDMKKEIKSARKADGEAQVNYESDRKALRDTLRAQTKSKVELEKSKADLGLKIADTKEFKKQRSDDLGSEDENKEALDKNCKWVETHFKTRREKRKTEIEGLVDAKNYLAGVDE